jgi:hypothetical protein
MVDHTEGKLSMVFFKNAMSAMACGSVAFPARLLPWVLTKSRNEGIFEFDSCETFLLR